MPNKTISVPDDVVPIIERLDVPFSRLVTDQLRRQTFFGLKASGKVIAETWAVVDSLA